MSSRHSTRAINGAPKTQRELDQLINDIKQQRVKPAAHEIAAMALMLFAFIIAVLVFSLAATQTL